MIGRVTIDQEDMMFVIAMLGGLVTGGAAFALLKRLGQSSNRQGKDVHIV